MKHAPVWEENIVKYLIFHGVNINQQVCEGTVPLFKVCLNRKVNIVKYLIEYGPEIIKKKEMTEKHYYFMRIKLRMKI